MNECRIVEDLIPLYAEELTNEEAAQFVENHVANCDHCRKLLERSRESVPTTEEDAKAYKKALRKNRFNLICKVVLASILTLMIGVSASEKLVEHISWMEGKAPVEQVAKAPVGNGEVTLVDWEASGYRIGGAENEGTLIWIKQMKARREENGTGYNMHEGCYGKPWENVQVYWSPDGTKLLITADLIDGGNGMFIHTYNSWYDEDGGHHGESKLLPNGAGSGLIDVLTAFCAEHPEFPTGWESIEFTFHQWLDDSETITFVYETDTGLRGLIDYHFPTEAITKVN